MPLDTSMTIVQEYVALGDPQAATAGELAERIAARLLEHAPGDVAAMAAIRYIRAKHMWRGELVPALERFYRTGVPIPEPAEYLRLTGDEIERRFGQRIPDPVLSAPVTKKAAPKRRSKK